MYSTKLFQVCLFLSLLSSPSYSMSSTPTVSRSKNTLTCSIRSLCTMVLSVDISYRIQNPFFETFFETFFVLSRFWPLLRLTFHTFCSCLTTFLSLSLHPHFAVGSRMFPGMFIVMTAHILYCTVLYCTRTTP